MSYQAELQQQNISSPRKEYLPQIFPARGARILENEVYHQLLHRLEAKRPWQIIGMGLDTGFIRRVESGGTIWLVSTRDPH